MKKQMLTVIQNRQRVYSFLAEIFLTPIPTPGQEYTLKLFNAIKDFSDQHSELKDYEEGMRLLKNFKAATACGNPENIQKELAMDRTRLCRGIDKDVITPPYEALYLMPQREWDHLLHIVNFYRKAGLKMDPANLERMDYIGIEFAFMAEMCSKEIIALKNKQEQEYEKIWELEKEFLNEHLLKWVPDYCKQVIKKAHTEFFRGLAHLIIAFLQEEKEQF